MITRIMDISQLDLLPKHGVEALKIRALADAYGVGYDFCVFYSVGKRAFLASLDGAFVLSEGAGICYEELSDFLAVQGCKELFCSERAAKKIVGYREEKAVSLCRFFGEAETEDYRKNPPLDEVYSVLKTAFNIPYEPWYADMSHRIRHGVSSCAMLGNSAALVIQHNINGEALLSQIAVMPDARKQGMAKRLIRAVCAELCDIYVLCENELIEFYGKCGFKRTEEKSVLYF